MLFSVIIQQHPQKTRGVVITDHKPWVNHWFSPSHAIIEDLTKHEISKSDL